MEQYFAYGDRETDYLRQRDSKLAEAIERLGRPRRRVMPDLFQALTWSILGQQISTKVCEAVWSRMLAGLGEVTPGRVMEESVASLQKFGTSFRKAGYIHSIAEQIVTGAFDLDALREMDDAEVCVVSVGITARVAKNAIVAARKEGVKVGMIRPITLYPFPKEPLAKAAAKVKSFLTVELNMGQMNEDVKLAINCSKPVNMCNRVGGMIPSADEVLSAIRKEAK